MAWQAVGAGHEQHEHLAAALEQRLGGAAGGGELRLLAAGAAQRLRHGGRRVAPECRVALDLRGRQRGARVEQVRAHVQRGARRSLAPEPLDAEVRVERHPPRQRDELGRVLAELFLAQARRLDHRRAHLLAVARDEHRGDAHVGERHDVRARAAQVPGHGAGVGKEDAVEPPLVEHGVHARPLERAFVEGRECVADHRAAAVPPQAGAFAASER
jgi:hypothetical protein